MDLEYPDNIFSRASFCYQKLNRRFENFCLIHSTKIIIGGNVRLMNTYLKDCSKQSVFERRYEHRNVIYLKFRLNDCSI